MRDLQQVFAAIASAHPAVPAATPQPGGEVVAPHPPPPAVEPDTTLRPVVLPNHVARQSRPRRWRLVAIGGVATVGLGAGGYAILQPRRDPATETSRTIRTPARKVPDAGHADTPSPLGFAEALAQSNPFVSVGDLRVQAHQITRGEYAAYLETLPAAGRRRATPLEEWDGSRQDAPVGWTRFEQASELCAAIHARLPTFQEWRRASGGSWGLDPTGTDQRGPLREWTAERTGEFIRVAGATATMTDRQRADALKEQMSLLASEATGAVGATVAAGEVAATSVSDREVGVRCVK